MAFASVVEVKRPSMTMARQTIVKCWYILEAIMFGFGVWILQIDSSALRTPKVSPKGEEIRICKMVF